MNKKFLLTLLSSPVLFTSIISTVMLTRPVHASPANTSAGTHLSCVMSPHTATPQKVCIQVSNTPANVTISSTQVAQATGNDADELNFSDAESDQAIKLFGCDCPVCINAVRQLNGLPPLPV
ncbi:hypothetical protein H6F32_11965 [Anabaena sp. FACHB-1237]|uniref:hypothetical protein n=1 Tax=Anabaena sp. FACHB-1237 TaxID=2692769 RepID=UPI001680342D|nr:hypothetical protein [Anabaena sp. FACHB-1237]MBD2138289.1 hypothetical protein [Anabaena sp. FACHB-1237]